MNDVIAQMHQLSEIIDISYSSRSYNISKVVLFAHQSMQARSQGVQCNPQTCQKVHF